MKNHRELAWLAVIVTGLTLCLAYFLPVNPDYTVRCSLDKARTRAVVAESIPGSGLELLSVKWETSNTRARAWEFWIDGKPWSFGSVDAGGGGIGALVLPDGVVIPGGSKLEVVCYPVDPIRGKARDGHTDFEIYVHRLQP